MVLWTDNLFRDTLGRKSGMKTFYDLHIFWTSMSAILASFFS